ncbi:MULTISPECIES: DUF2780 domain-containing protein [unclassified Vibrio]|uniref:DUF2780 domain-containing protein n=1 Tax=unclassified Vibrio TaxID=2614977 RepID=UPI001361B38F|nr:MULTISPECIES: DUF2780 domain-containing protein [unclassified Vibrio]NAW56323.1 DUF2780 domain-containing protein [Vibrio sp. V36_P2S2PM302]NAX26643.1 DUF2780 domain-containing protein [Vibrio sp. V38_P2S17PM301]NAX30817.1 DUF2780 domain-containing protein [Vibrio sp. V37_P2S8PM304]
MNKALFVLAGCLAMTACQSTGSQPTSQSLLPSTPLTKSVAGNLAEQLNITPTQAATGAGALLSYAQNALSPENSQELSSMTGGLSSLDLSSLTNTLNNMESVKSAFSAVGLSPEMVTQFTPIILKALQSQGASSSLLSGLSALWS